MFRLIITIICVIPIFILVYPFLFIEWVIGKSNRRTRDFTVLRTAQGICKSVLWLSGTKVTVIGKENILDEAALYVANHQSIFDVIVTYKDCKNLTGFVSKNSMEKVPFFSDYMKFLYCLFLDRSDIKQGLQVILQAIDYVKKGISIVIFPEGTRNKGDALSLLPFKEGSFKIALKSGCPIVPVTIAYNTDVFENHIPRLKKTHVIVEYGTPIYPKELSKDEQKGIGASCQKLIEKTLEKNLKLF